MTFKEFCDRYPEFKVTYKERGSYYFLVEKNNDKFIYRFNIDKVQYIKNNIVSGEVRELRSRDILCDYSGSFCTSRSIEYKDFLKLYKNLFGRIICYSSSGEIIIPEVDDLHNYKYFYINGDMFHLSNNDRVVEFYYTPYYNYNTYTKESFENSINVNDLL